MAKKNALFSAPPHEVERIVKLLGRNLKTARLRRNMTTSDVAEKIGVDRRAITRVESGKLSTGIAIYVAMLWAYDLIGQLGEIADPALDEIGKALSDTRVRARSATEESLDNDF